MQQVDITKLPMNILFNIACNCEIKIHTKHFKNSRSNMVKRRVLAPLLYHLLHWPSFECWLPFHLEWLRIYVIWEGLLICRTMLSYASSCSRKRLMELVHRPMDRIESWWNWGFYGLSYVEIWGIYSDLWICCLWPSHITYILNHSRWKGNQHSKEGQCSKWI